MSISISRCCSMNTAVLLSGLLSLSLQLLLVVLVVTTVAVRLEYGKLMHRVHRGELTP